jgi:hypothetical protein
MLRLVVDAPAEAASGARHAGRRLGAFALTAAAVALVLAVAVEFIDRDQARPVVMRPSGPVAFAAASARPTAEPVSDARMPLYVVSSSEAAFRLERALARLGYIELHGGHFPPPWAITILGNGVTWEDIEHMNLYRIESGLYPFRVVDLTEY